MSGKTTSQERRQVITWIAIAARCDEKRRDEEDEARRETGGLGSANEA
jgi:hypothetical protein